MIEDLLRTILGLPPGVNKVNKDLAQMRIATRPLLEQVIPWESDKELELLSLRVDAKSQKDGIEKIIVGSVLSIYFEPMVVFAWKDYGKSARENLLYCRTINKELVFRIKPHQTEVYLNTNLVAYISQDRTMMGYRTKKTIGGIRPYSGDLLSVVVLGKEAGHLFNPARPHSEVQRALYLMNDMNEEEEGIFLALVLYELITRKLESKKK